MRKRFISVAMLLAILVSLIGATPVASQDPDGTLQATPLTPAGVTVNTSKEKVHIVEPQPMRAATQGLEIEPVAPISIIVTFDESVDTSELEAVSGGVVVHRYEKIFNGASLILQSSKVDAVAELNGVTGVYLDEMVQVDTDTSPNFIGATRLWKQIGGQQSAGEGIVVGILDTGIWPEHPSFTDPDPMGNAYPAPPGGPYECDFGNTAYNPNDAPFTCNNKLIGAYTFIDTYKAYVGLLPTEFDSARDDNGHGTHTSSTAAGNAGVETDMLGVPRGTVSGIAPRAHVIMYRVCGEEGCYNSDSAAAVEQAILDGVDILNFSIGGGTNPYSDIVSLAFLSAYDNGVFVAASAGNAGPNADTVGHREPWVTTVGASTHNRTYAATVELTDGTDTLTLEGASITGGLTADVVMASDYGDGMCLTPFAPGTFDGQIVVCERGTIARVTKSYNVQQGGAGGMILYNPALQGLSSDPHYVPSIHIENDAGVALLDFMATHSGVTGTLSGGVQVEAQGDVMAAFSSRGGPAQSLGVSKPDIAAPGVQILAGNTPLGALQGPGGMGPYGELFQAIDGTSMASPHIAGSAALLMQLHPDWTPGQIKSALMTSAQIPDVVKEDGETPADPFDYGSGRVDLRGAGKVSLTISATAQDFIDHEDDLWNANYPSIYIPGMPGKMTLQRTVASSLDTNSTWYVKASPYMSDDFTIKVPRMLTIGAGQEATFDIDIDARNVPMGETRFGFITLNNRQTKEWVRIPVTFVRQEPNVTLDKSCDPANLGRNETTDCTITISNTSYDDATVSLVDVLPRQFKLIGDPVGATRVNSRQFTFDGTLAGAAPPEVSVDTGFTPFGYLPLASIGAPPNVAHTDESCANFSATFVYAGEVYDTIGMVSNGYAVVGGCTSSDDIQYINQVLPDPTAPNNVLAPFWTDLNPDNGGSFYAYTIGDGVNSWLVLEWENVPNWGDGELNSFQIWIGVDGVEDISFGYGAVSDGDGGWLTVGAENAYGNSGANYYADGVGTLPAAGTDVAVSSIPGAPGETVTITYTAKAIRVGDWQNCAEMTGDTFYGTNVACFEGSVQ
ncbi:MAG: S8 family serine peptidase [Anaerolineae bacterium]|nr:S8 family serine peptidase [Anaerolineae bacterium]